MTRPPPLQAHRTALSWLRVGFTAGVASVLALRAALLHRHPAYVAAAVVLVAVMFVALVTYRRRSLGATIDAPIDHRALPGTAAWLTVLIVVAGTLVVVATAF